MSDLNGFSRPEARQQEKDGGEQENIDGTIGRPTPLREGREKVTGRINYTGDMQLSGMLHARPVLSPHAHARIKSVQTDQAQALPGVVGVLTAEDLPNLDPRPKTRSRALLASDRVLFNGQPVAVVLAEDEGSAQDAADLVQVDYDPLPAVVDPLAAMEEDAPLVWPTGIGGESDEGGAHGATEAEEEEETGGNVANKVHFERGDVDAGFQEADLVLERTFRTSSLHQSYIEPHATIAGDDPNTGTFTVWTSTQAQYGVRSQVAEVLDMSESEVRVVPMTVGGGFGGKFVLLEPLVATLAQMTGRPVGMTLTRMEEFLTATPGQQSIIKVKTGVKRDGTLTALQARVVLNSGSFAFGLSPITCMLLGGYYRFPNLYLEGIDVLTHTPATGAYRAPGSPQATFAIESLMDDMARQLGLDPLAFRLKNAVDEGDPMPNGDPWPRIGLKACLERIREHPMWRDRKEVPGRGYGLAIGGWLGGLEPASAVCRMNRDGTVNVLVGSVDITGTHTGMALIAAEALGVSLEDVKVVGLDTERGPYAGGSGGSKITYTVGAAVQRAAEDARYQLLQVAADQLEARTEDMVMDDGKIWVKGTPDTAVEVSEIASMTMKFGGRYEPIFGRGASAITDQAPGFSAQLAEVEVDEETGQVQITNYLAIQDVGRAINPMTVEGQMQGGVAQGVGWGLFEAMGYEGSGSLVTGTFQDYAIPKATDVSSIATEIVEVPSPDGPYGARGVGEPPVTAGAAAIANAVRDAAGVRVTQLPITPERLFRAMREREDSAEG